MKYLILVLGLSAASIILYACSWLALSALDKSHCEYYGVEYHSTDHRFNGFCDVGGLKVKAEYIGDD